MNIAGPYCPISSYLGGKLTSEWVSSEDTDIRATFAREREVAKLFPREIAKMRGEVDDYERVLRDDWAEPGGFRQ